MNIEKYTQNAQGAIIDCQNIAVEEWRTSASGSAHAEGWTDSETVEIYEHKYGRSHRSGTAADR